LFRTETPEPHGKGAGGMSRKKARKSLAGTVMAVVQVRDESLYCETPTETDGKARTISACTRT